MLLQCCYERRRLHCTLTIIHSLAYAAMPMEMGMLPLRRDLVAQNLDSHALTLLCPPPLGSPLSISFSAWESRAGTHTLDAVSNSH